MKKRENFTIDEDLMKDFERYVASESISKSATVENLIRDFLNSKKKKTELIEKEQVYKFNNLMNELIDYKSNVAELSYALHEVIDDEICCELLKENDLYSEVNDLLMNMAVDYDYLADELDFVCGKAVHILKKKNNAKFLLKDYLSDELSSVDEDYITENGIDYDEWVEENEKLGLDINRYKYLINPNIFDAGNIYYFGDKIASKLELAPNIRCHDTFGIKRIAEREILYAKDGDCLRFNPDFNPFALYYFLKDYKEIDTDNIFEIFEGLYSSITENGIDKIPSEVIDYVTKYSPYTTEEILEKLNGYLNRDLKEEDIIEVYKHSYKDRINFKTNLVWNLNKEDVIDKTDSDKEGLTVKGEVQVKDILAVKDDCSGYIFADYNSIKNINIIKRELEESTIVDKIDVAIVRYIYELTDSKKCSFELEDLLNHLETLNISISEKELIDKLLYLPHIQCKKIEERGVYTTESLFCLISKVRREGSRIFVTKSK